MTASASVYPPVEMPWWKSRVIIGALLSAVLKLVAAFGVAVDFTGEQEQAIVTILALIGSLVGDFIAARARVEQKHAPAISKLRSKGGGATLSILLACALLLPLSACLGVQERLPAAPAAVADETKLDEQTALTLTLAYTGAARAATLAIEAGLVDDAKTIERIGQLDRSAFAAVKAAERAYRAGNADSYASAIVVARGDISALLSAVTGDVE